MDRRGRATAARLAIIVTTVFVCASAAAPGAEARGGPPRVPDSAAQDNVNAEIANAFHASYSLDLELALATARHAVAQAPDNPRARRTLASVLWLQIIFERGAVTIDYYLAGIAKSQLGLPPPRPELDTEFKQELAKSIALNDARLKVRSKDLDALGEIGKSYGLEASYTASVEGSLVPAFRSAKRAYDAEEEVLERAPQQIGAGLIVGTYRYLVSTLAAPARMFAYIVGFGGGKETGIKMVERATSAVDTHVEAKTSLALIFSREGRHIDALRLLGELAAEFPRNRLFVLEQGSAAIRAGKGTEADAILTRGLDAFDRDDRLKIPGERALWLYKRGVARTQMNRATEAAVDLNAALASGPVDWMRGRTLLQLGRLDDLGGRRPEALAKYREAKRIADAINDPVCSAEAGRLISR